MRFALVLSTALLTGCTSANDPEGREAGQGYILTYKHDLTEPSQLGYLRDAICSKLEGLNFRGVEVRLPTAGRVEVFIPTPAPSTLELAKTVIRNSAHLEVGLLAKKGFCDDMIERARVQDAVRDQKKQRSVRWAVFDPRRVELPKEAIQRDRDGSMMEVLVVIEDLHVNETDVKSVFASVDTEGRPYVCVLLYPAGAAVLQRLTSDNLLVSAEGAPRHLALVLDGEALSASRILSQLSWGFRIYGRFTEEECESMAGRIRVASLLSHLSLESVRTGK